MRVAIAAALPFPLPQGSQLFVEGQARALAAAGAEVTLFCYGTGEGEPPPDLRLVRVPRALSPGALRAGPSPGKPLADALLARLLARAAGSVDVVLAHNGEAALAALLARPVLRAPVVYVAHTLLGNELDAFAPAFLAGLARGFGDGVDRGIAARADGVIALCGDAARRLAAFARGPVEVIPPGLDPQPPPDAASIERACARAGVTRERFVLYTGNLDRYQNLDSLAAAAQLAPRLPIVVATHGARRLAAPGLRCLRVDPAEARALAFGCGVAVAPRARAGGFPIKLLHYMEAGRAIVAREGIADSLEHGRSAWLLPRAASPAELAAALGRLLDDPERARRLGHAARATLEARHAWPALAGRTLDFATRVRRATRPGGAPS